MKATAIKVFIPSHNYCQSQAFYQAMGFTMDKATEQLCIFDNGLCSFFLHEVAQEQQTSQLMCQMIVENIDDVYSLLLTINNNDISFGPIKQERWGKVIYLTGPSGELWHVTALNSA